MTCNACDLGGTRRHTCSPELRFWHRVRIGPGACWEWKGRTNGRYGTFYPAGRGSSVYAHRFAYERTIEPLRPGEVVMHTCDNPRCVRVAHLRAGTQRENLWDMWRKGRGDMRSSPLKTTCAQGHPYTEENTMWRVRHGRRGRECRECNRIRCAERAERVRRQKRDAA